MVRYYIKMDGIVVTETQVDESWREMTAEELTFYQQHPYATPDEVLQQILLYQAERDLAAARSNKQLQIQTEEEAMRSAGWEDTQTGLRLFLRDEDTIRYMQFKVKHLGKADDAILQIGTYQGWQPLTKAVAFDMLDRYGDYAEDLYQTFSTRYGMLGYATTIEQINLI